VLPYALPQTGPQPAHAEEWVVENRKAR
jgi:hypothetical protein